MAVETVDAELAGVELVAIRDGLFGLVTGIDHSWVGIIGISGDSAYGTQADHGTENL